MSDAASTDDDVERIESLLRDLGPEDSELLRPPDVLWERIDAAVHEADSVSASGDVVQMMRPQRSRWIVPGIAAAAAAVVLLVAAVAVVSGNGDPDPVVARAELSYDPVAFDELGRSAMADAELIEGDDGRYRLRIVESSLPSADAEGADLELWLIQPDDDAQPVDLVSLGVLDPGDSGDFDIPPEYDPADFYVVDISVEPRDGVAAHSGRSILRGGLVPSA